MTVVTSRSDFEKLIANSLYDAIANGVLPWIQAPYRWSIRCRPSIHRAVRRRWEPN